MHCITSTISVDEMTDSISISASMHLEADVLMARGGMSVKGGGYVHTRIQRWYGQREKLMRLANGEGICQQGAWRVLQRLG